MSGTRAGRSLVLVLGGGPSLSTRLWVLKSAAGPMLARRKRPDCVGGESGKGVCVDLDRGGSGSMRDACMGASEAGRLLGRRAGLTAADGDHIDLKQPATQRSTGGLFAPLGTSGNCKWWCGSRCGQGLGRMDRRQYWLGVSVGIRPRAWATGDHLASDDAMHVCTVRMGSSHGMQSLNDSHARTARNEQGARSERRAACPGPAVGGFDRSASASLVVAQCSSAEQSGEESIQHPSSPPHPPSSVSPWNRATATTFWTRNSITSGAASRPALRTTPSASGTNPHRPRRYVGTCIRAC